MITTLKKIPAISLLAFLGALVLFGGAGFILLNNDAGAQAGSFSTPVAMTGYLWASTNNNTGVGWISLNCSNDSTCSGGDYSVVINPNKTITGFGWGEHVGWVQFGGLSGCPGGNCAARVTGDDASGYEFSGWARALAHSDPDSGGWDGWISLNCNNHSGCGSSNYAVSINNDGSFPASANGWGSDVMGRVNFAFADVSPPCIAGNACTTDYLATEYTNMWCETDAPVACTGDDTCNPNTAACEQPPVINGELVFNPQLVRKGQRVELSWDIDPATPVISCRAEGSNGDNLASPGLTQVIETSVTTYTLHCIPDYGGGTEGAEQEVTTAELRAIANVYGS